MTDVLDQVAAHNPVRDEDLRSEGLTVSFEDLWRDLDHPRPPKRARPFRLHRPAIVGGAATALAATTLAIVLASAGGAPSAAQAFPILGKRGTNISGVRGIRQALASVHDSIATWPSSTTALFAALDDAHLIPIPTGNGETLNGFVLESPDGSTVCLALWEIGPAGIPGSVVHGAFGPVVCDSTTDAQAHGFVAVGSATNYQTNGDVFVALVPTGATAELTADGTTATPVAVNDGVATGLAAPHASLSITVEGTTQTTPLVASTQPWWPPAAAPGASSSTGGSERATGATGTTPGN